MIDESAQPPPEPATPALVISVPTPAPASNAMRAAFDVWLARRYVCVDGALSMTMVAADINKVLGYALATLQVLGHETGPFAVACVVLNSHLNVWLRERTSKPLLRKTQQVALEKEGA